MAEIIEESLFPFIDGDIEESEVQEELPIPKEYAWDFERDCFVIENGKMKIVEGKEAIQIWAIKALRTARYRYLAYSWNYGSELEDLIGSSFSNKAIESEATRYIEEALLVNPYITGIDNVEVSFTGDELSIKGRIMTIYGEVDINV